MTHPSTWKNLERTVARKLGGKRKPHDGTGGEDVEHPLFSIECKLRAKLPKILTEGMDQARRQAPEGKIPLFVLAEKYKGRRLYVLEECDFVDLHGAAFMDHLLPPNCDRE